MGKKRSAEEEDRSVIIDLGERVFIGKIIDKKKFNVEELKKDERLIFDIIKERKEISQCKLSKISGFSKFKICRIVRDLEDKELIKREKSGLTFLIRLRD